MALSNQGNAPVFAGSGWQSASIAIYVPPGPFTLNVGGFVSGRAHVDFTHFRVSQRIPPGSAPMSPEARSYLLEALDRVEQVSLFAPPQGWPELREWALAQAAGAQSTADTHPALQLALQRLQDRHSSFNPPVPAPRATGVGIGSVAEPVFGSEPGVLSIPAFLDRSEGAFERFAAALRVAVEEKVRERKCGVVVDLRDNGGGNMWPMLVGISALFPDQVLGKFISPKQTQAWAARDGLIYLGDRPVLASVPGQHLRDTPVAVLIGPGTASSGEAVAIALRSRPRTVLVGRPTAGLVTANRVLDLKDGAFIALSTSRMADPSGRIQEGPVQPALPGSGGAGELELAREWLRAQCLERSVSAPGHKRTTSAVRF